MRLRVHGRRPQDSGRSVTRSPVAVTALFRPSPRPSYKHYHASPRQPAMGALRLRVFGVGSFFNKRIWVTKRRQSEHEIDKPVQTPTAEKKVEGVQGAWWMPKASRAEEGRG
jgi:hypothetical protein